ncbi:hypothetical protein [Shewanella colwelliana]|uniref:hypothetical protein n=1 Tax=Shewanella colwelliana TaxID=23 RepID=UPI0037355068
MSLKELTEEQVKLSKEMVKFPLRFCNACYFGNPADHGVKINNGTMTLVRYKGERFGITNYHVVDAYRDRQRNESDIDFYIGNARIELGETLFDEDKELDLCVLYLDGYDEKEFSSDGEIPTHFYEIDDFTLGNLKEGGFVLFGGFPGVWRSRPKSNHLIFDSLSSGSTEVTEVTSRNIRCELSLEKCLVTLEQHHKEFPENLGGLSGGPVFLNQVHSSGISTFKLIGFIYEHMAEYDSIMVRPLSFINDKFWISR